MIAGDADSSLRRVAIVHYTAQPAIGGIESLLAHQCAVLQALGHQPVCVVGRGAAPSGTETFRIPLLDPSHASVMGASGAPADALPADDHPVVQQLLAELLVALDGCTDCWVHNALTVSLNPFCTAALCALISQRPGIRWVSWSADLSSTSRFGARGVRAISSGMEMVRERVSWVAISCTRRDELSTSLRLSPDRIQVVNPPLDILAWLDIGRQARLVIEALDLLECGPAVLVPSKVLAHKCLDRAVRAGIALAGLGADTRMLLTAAPSPHEPRSSDAIVTVLRNSIQCAGVGSAVTLLPDLLGEVPTNRTVRELMQLCDVVFVPSIEEGFGMPLREAAALGVPVVCTDIPVFREVAGDIATFFNPASDDREVASLLLAAARKGRSPARAAALRSMIQFRAEIQQVLHLAVQPKV